MSNFLIKLSIESHAKKRFRSVNMENVSFQLPSSIQITSVGRRGLIAHVSQLRSQTTREINHGSDQRYHVRLHGDIGSFNITKYMQVKTLFYGNQQIIMFQDTSVSSYNYQCAQTPSKLGHEILILIYSSAAWCG